ncbi:MAG: hypothetical protein FWD45_00180 [Coriobacteriia bacterium]|nr:hypothetical protein [Coriobacteriia bacterium]
MEPTERNIYEAELRQDRIEEAARRQAVCQDCQYFRYPDCAGDAGLSCEWGICTFDWPAMQLGMTPVDKAPCEAENFLWRR